MMSAKSGDSLSKKSRAELKNVFEEIENNDKLFFNTFYSLLTDYKKSYAGVIDHDSFLEYKSYIAPVRGVTIKNNSVE